MIIKGLIVTHSKRNLPFITLQQPSCQECWSSSGGLYTAGIQSILDTVQTPTPPLPPLHAYIFHRLESTQACQHIRTRMHISSICACLHCTTYAPKDRHKHKHTHINTHTYAYNHTNTCAHTHACTAYQSFRHPAVLLRGSLRIFEPLRGRRAERMKGLVHHFC